MPYYPTKPYIALPYCSTSHENLDLGSLPGYQPMQQAAEGVSAAEAKGEHDGDDKLEPLPCSKCKFADSSECSCGNCDTVSCIKQQQVSGIASNMRYVVIIFFFIILLVI